MGLTMGNCGRNENDNVTRAKMMCKCSMAASVVGIAVALLLLFFLGNEPDVFFASIAALICFLFIVIGLLLARRLWK